MSARPRRSVAGNTSYQISFPDLPGSSDEQSEGEEENADGQDQQDGQDGQDGAGAAGSANDEDDEGIESDGSGSVYAPAVVKDKDGTLVEEEGSDEDDATDLEDAEDEDEDDDDSAAGEKELDDISIATSAGMSEDSEAGRGGGQGLKHGRAVGGKSAASMRVVGRTPLAMMGNTGGIAKKAGPRRSMALTSARGAAAKTPFYDLTYTQSYVPPRFVLTKPWNDRIHSPQSNETGGTEARAAFTEQSAQKMIKRNAYLPFGPLWAVCEDHSYYKGKYERFIDDKGNEEVDRSTRWGGWYDEVPLEFESYAPMNDIRYV